jgi:hypothetical protein
LYAALQNGVNEGNKVKELHKIISQSATRRRRNIDWLVLNKVGTGYIFRMYCDNRIRRRHEMIYVDECSTVSFSETTLP